VPLKTNWVTGDTVDDVYLNALDTQVNTNTTDIATKQASDSDLTAIAALAPSNDDIIQRKAGAWTNRTIAQVKTDLAVTKSDVGLGNVDNTSNATERAAAATLANKTINNTNTVTVKDTLLTIQDDGDATKQAQFQASGITAGQTRVLTIPDASTTLVGSDTAQALTSKTIAIGSNTVTGSVSDFNTALTGADFYTSGGTDVPVADGGTGVSTLTGIVKGNGTSAFSAAVSGTDYAPATSGSSILKGNGSGGFSAATAGTDYYNPGGTDIAITDGGTGVSTLPTGLLKGAGTSAITAAAAGTDYVAPGGALGTPSSGNLANCTFPTLNQNTSGTAASAATLTTPRTINGVSFNGSANIVVKPVPTQVSNTTSWTINSDAVDYAENTGLTGAVTINNPTGTPGPGQRLWVSLTGTASRAISYGTAFEDSTVTRPTTTSGTAPLDIGFRWNAATSKWRCVAVA
jgi:hypothetical protein